MDARDFGMSIDPFEIAEDEVRPYRCLSPRERFERFLGLMSFLERIWRSLPAEKRVRYDRAQAELDDAGKWWERVPSK